MLRGQGLLGVSPVDPGPSTTGARGMPPPCWDAEVGTAVCPRAWAQAWPGAAAAPGTAPPERVGVSHAAPLPPVRGLRVLVAEASGCLVLRGGGAEQGGRETGVHGSPGRSGTLCVGSTACGVCVPPPRLPPPPRSHLQGGFYPADTVFQAARAGVGSREPSRGAASPGGTSRTGEEPRPPLCARRGGGVSGGAHAPESSAAAGPRHRGCAHPGHSIASAGTCSRRDPGGSSGHPVGGARGGGQLCRGGAVPHPTVGLEVGTVVVIPLGG